MLFGQIEDSDDEVPELVENEGGGGGEEGAGAIENGSSVVIKQNRAEKKSRKVFPPSESYFHLTHNRFRSL